MVLGSINAVLESQFIRAKDISSRRLMVVLHGLGDSPAGYRWMPEAMRLPWLNYLLVQAPDFYYGGYSWYDFNTDPAPGILRSRQLLFELLDDQRQQGYETSQTILSGFSQGCLMTVDTGLRYPHRFAGLIGISGYIHEPLTLLKELSPVARQQRLLITHGLYDPLISFDQVKKQFQLLKAEELHIEWREFAKEHTIAGEEEISVIREFIGKCFEESSPPS